MNEHYINVEKGMHCSERYFYVEVKWYWNSWEILDLTLEINDPDHSATNPLPASSKEEYIAVVELLAYAGQAKDIEVEVCSGDAAFNASWKLMAQMLGMAAHKATIKSARKRIASALWKIRPEMKECQREAEAHDAEIERRREEQGKK